MLNTAAFIVDNFSLFEKNKLQSGNVLFLLEIETNSSFNNYSLGDFYKLSPSQHVYPFSFYFRIETGEYAKAFYTWLQENKSFLFTYFFHPSYHITFEKPTLFFNDAMKQDANIQEIIKQLELSAIEQGFKGIHPVWFTAKRSELSADNQLMINVDQSLTLSTIYSELLEKSFYVSKYIGVYSNNMEKDLQCLLETESKLASQNTELDGCLKRINSLERDTATLRSQLKKVTSQLDNEKKYLEIYKNQDESKKINDFYYHEYEILPTWYKKIGHILKVLTGKRKFRSLFDSNVKKYKN